MAVAPVDSSTLLAFTAVTPIESCSMQVPDLLADRKIGPDHLAVVPHRCALIGRICGHTNLPQDMYRKLHAIFVAHGFPCTNAIVGPDDALGSKLNIVIAPKMNRFPSLSFWTKIYFA